MIGKGGTRSGHHAGAMGESNGDLNGMEVLNEYGFVPVSGENPYAVGAYATGSKTRGIRNFAMNDSPLNFSDMGYDITGPQVHADGEIWSATNFDIRAALVAKYGAGTPALQRECADGKRPADQCPGNRRWAQLMYDAYLLMPVAPTMLQARDAYLAADQMRFGGANQLELWRAFARRGFGETAFSTNTAADTDTDPKPDFASPVHNEAAVTFAAVAADEGNAPITKARVYVGRYEARVSPVADTDPSTTAPAPGTNNLDQYGYFVPGTYEFVVHAPGYGHVRLTRTFTAGQRVTVTVPMRTNWASRSKGAAAFGDGTRLADLIDDTEKTNWQADGGPVQGRSVVVDLAGGVRTVGRVQVSAMLVPGQNRFTALRQFQIWTCNAAEANCNGPEDYTLRLTSPADAFPGDAPRPVSPALLLRSFSLPAAVAATHVRFVVVENQCTGQVQFQGTQDNDPATPNDCRTGKEGPEVSILAPRDTSVVAAELQAFSR
jgi:extracellular elastinolytic metalloproteinase